MSHPVLFVQIYFISKTNPNTLATDFKKQIHPNAGHLNSVIPTIHGKGYDIIM
jgi:hypothetical protein